MCGVPFHLICHFVKRNLSLNLKFRHVLTEPSRKNGLHLKGTRADRACSSIVTICTSESRDHSSAIKTCNAEKISNFHSKTGTFIYGKGASLSGSQVSILMLKHDTTSETTQK